MGGGWDRSPYCSIWTSRVVKVKGLNLFFFYLERQVIGRAIGVLVAVGDGRRGRRGESGAWGPFFCLHCLGDAGCWPGGGGRECRHSEGAEFHKSDFRISLSFALICLATNHVAGICTVIVGERTLGTRNP